MENRYKYVKGVSAVVEGDTVLSNGTSPNHMKAVAHLLGGDYNAHKHRIRLPHPMTGAEVRRALGVLWRGVSCQ